MKKQSKLLKRKLTRIINEMASDLKSFVVNPEKDFTRKRKLDFKTMFKFLLTMNGGSTQGELIEHFNYDVNTPTTSAFLQQRKKILPYAFKYLLKKQLEQKKKWIKHKGYRLIAVDGSQLPIPFNPKDTDTFKRNANQNERGCNSLLINALYDLNDRLYLDVDVQGLKSMNETKACEKLITSNNIKGKKILIADRGYESYSLISTLQDANWKYLIRVKDKASNGIISKNEFPDEEEADFDIKRDLTYSDRKELKKKYKNLKAVKKNRPILVMERDGLESYHLDIRVVRVQIGDGLYETLITNLPRKEFNPDELKGLYNQRWGIETSFRELKYTIGLSNIHSKNRFCMEQEILAKLVMYNYCESVTTNVVIKQNKKYIYKANFTKAVKFCKQFLSDRGTKKPIDVEALIGKNILPIRPGRVAPRRKRKTTNVSFLYRVQ